MDVMKALHEWKKGGRGETMMSTFEYKASHDKMFIEGFREAEAHFEEETVEMRKRYNDLFVQFNQLIGRHEWHDLEIDPKDLPNNDCAEVFVKYRMSTTNPIQDGDCDYTVGFYDTNGKWVLKSFSWDRPNDDKDNMYGHEVLAWREIH